MHYYIANDFSNATEAYKKAYIHASDDTARVQSCRLLASPNIQALIADELKKVLDKARIPLEKRILGYWTTRAFYDVTEIIGLDGKVKITDEQLRERGLTAVVDGVVEKLNAQGMPYLEIDLANRDKALDQLQKYIQMIKAPDQRVIVENVTIGEPPTPPACALPAQEQPEGGADA